VVWKPGKNEAAYKRIVPAHLRKKSIQQESQSGRSSGLALAFLASTDLDTFSNAWSLFLIRSADGRI
jgi:hypothetical protein